MSIPIPRFPDLTARHLRAINRLTHRLVEAPDLETLGREFIHEMSDVLPADLMVWNVWTPAMDSLLSVEVNHDHFLGSLNEHGEALIATIHHHPIIAAGGLDRAWHAPQRMTDYQAYGAFKSNPLYQEVYRHLDSNYQIAYNVAKLDDAHLILSWNLKQRDFTDREMQLLHLAGQRLAMISIRLEEACRLKSAWAALSGTLANSSGLGAGLSETAPVLGVHDGKILGSLVRGETRSNIAAGLNWRRDTLDRHLGALRERLGLESTPQLMQALAGLKPPAS